MKWEINTDLVEQWLLSLDQDTYLQVRAALGILESDGPRLGRPLVDTIRGSRYQNLKELRPGSSGRSEIRILFVFDPTRRAIMLVAGDKAGRWERWYREAIPQAERLIDNHLGQLKEGGGN